MAVPVYRLAGRLACQLGLSQPRALQADIPGDKRQCVNIVVFCSARPAFGPGCRWGEINDTEEIVVKPLRKQLKTVKTFAGSSIMGDGKVALILDVLGLAQRANVVSEARTTR